MARNSKVLIAAAMVVVLACLVAESTGDLLAGAGAFVIGMLGVAVLHQRSVPGGDDVEIAGTAKLDRARSGNDDPAGRAEAPPASTGSSTQTAAPGLPTWSSSALSAPPAEQPQAPAPLWSDDQLAAGWPARTTPSDLRSTRTTWQQRHHHAARRQAPLEEPGHVGEEYDAENPLGDLTRLDDVDPVAEVERLEGRAGVSSSTLSVSVPHLDEAAVRTDDDILTASHATELKPGNGEVSELARLLAKVQQRLAAYE